MSVDYIIISAVAKNRVIGKNNAMPWYLPTDLKRFKMLTLNRPLIMGRKTWESLKFPLPDRLNIVMTCDKSFRAQGGIVVHSLLEGCKIAEKEAIKNHIDEIFIIGGSQIFRQALPIVSRIYMTEIIVPVEGDVFFPYLNYADWFVVSSERILRDQRDTHKTRYTVYKRLSLF
ncbi:MAG: dihydrofolate reductase [Candidatus Tokpelaia sp. JSC161]|jgi:dihydrofolate reductase|nr:MAG: dihydrofolate reductase [Candidatus Tokpelaia sp. JSC161]